MSGRALAIAGALVLAWLAAPAGASAHAALEGSTPQRGATLETQPRQVVLRFGEPVAGNFGAVRAFDAAPGASTTVARSIPAEPARSSPSA